MFWVIEMSLRAPKTAIFAAMSRRLIDALTDAIVSCSMALNQPDLRSRIELIGLIKIHLDVAASIIRVWHQWSSRKDVKAGECAARIISNKQLAYYFTEMEKLGRQLAGWRNQTAKQLEATTAKEDKV